MPERPPARNGDTGELLAAEIENPVADVSAPEFPVVLRGYDRASVDAYVERVTRIVDELYAVRSPRAAIGRALDRVGEETAAILQRAHDAADELTAQSRARAEERRQTAEREAKALTADAEDRVRRLDVDTEELWRERRRLLEDTRRIGVSLQAAVDDAAQRFPAEDEPLPGEAKAEPEAPFDVETGGPAEARTPGKPDKPGAPSEPGTGATVELPPPKRAGS